MLHPVAGHVQDLRLDGISAAVVKLGSEGRVAGRTKGDEENARSLQARRPLKFLDAGAAVVDVVHGRPVKGVDNTGCGAGGVVIVVEAVSVMERPTATSERGVEAGPAESKPFTRAAAAASPETIDTAAAALRRRAAAERLRVRAICLRHGGGGPAAKGGRGRRRRGRRGRGVGRSKSGCSGWRGGEVKGSGRPSRRPPGRCVGPTRLPAGGEPRPGGQKARPGAAPRLPGRAGRNKRGVEAADPPATSPHARSTQPTGKWPA